MKSRSKISLNALKTFEAVARHGNMSVASQELSVTPGAVSRQMADLQAAVSFDLFDGPRHDRRLTPEGLLLAGAVTTALDDIDAVLLRLDESRDTVLDVACLSTMAIRWLIPRLHRFRANHPDIDIRLSTNPQQPDRMRNRLDLSIMVLAPTEVLGPKDRVLFAETLGPVIKPGLQDLDRVVLLTSKTRPQAWQEWQAQLTSPQMQPVGQSVFEHLSLAIEAAASGLGVCVTPEHLVRDDVAAGRLTAPWGFQPSGYIYVARAHGRAKGRSDRFIRWLCDDLGPQAA